MSGIELSAWVYPWDALRVGVDPMLDEFERLGIESLELAANYHPIEAYGARGPSPSIFMLRDGAVFFPPKAKYGDIEPKLWSDPHTVNEWPLIVERAKQRGFDVTAWIVALFQPWIAMSNPTAARVLPTGEINAASACPCSSIVQDYLTVLASDVVSVAPVDGLKLEGISLQPFDYGWVRPRILTSIPHRIRDLLSVCFCQSCLKVGEDEGVDTGRLRDAVMEEIRQTSSSRELRTSTQSETIANELPRYRSAQYGCVTESLSRIADAVHKARPGCRLTVAAPVEPTGASSPPLDELTSIVGGILIPSPASNPEHAEAVLRARVASGREIIVESYFPPFDAFHSLATGSTRLDDPHFEREIQAAVALPVDKLSIYNFGLLSADDLASCIDLVRSISAETI